MALNLTVIGVVVGLVAGQNSDPVLLLVVPILSPALGLLWFGNHVAISRIGSYIGIELWIWDTSWELWIAKIEPTHGRWWNRTWWPTVQLIFCGAPIVALGIGVPIHNHSVTAWAPWATGFALTTYLSVASTLLRRLPPPVPRVARRGTAGGGT